MGIQNRLAHAWNAFTAKEKTPADYSHGSSRRPDRTRLSMVSERSIIIPIYNKIATDVANISIRHVRNDQNGKFIEVIESGIDNVLNLEANLDQTGPQLIKDLVMSMFDEGCVALVPIDTDDDIEKANTFGILSMRVGKIVEWFPDKVRLQVYNERVGEKQYVVLSKRSVAIIENPFYAVMNEPNSTAKRLIQKINMIDSIDVESAQGKLDLIIQLPYAIKNETRRKMAEDRRKDIEMQLSGSKYGIAYTDGTEKITQLNRSLDNHLLEQVTYLTEFLYKQLGFTPAIFDGTADEATMLNYHNTTLVPVLDAIILELKRKFLTKTARTQGQSFKYFRDPFKLMPISSLADTADKLTRNEILTPNEVRAIIGYKPVQDPAADELRNRNISQSSNENIPAASIENNNAGVDEGGNNNEI